MLQVYKSSSIEWKPSPVVALATSPDDSKVAAAREDGSLEIWLVSPGAVGWHRQLTIHGDPSSRVSSLVWCRSESSGRLFSSSIDGSISEWDLFDLKQKVVISIGVSIWQMAATTPTKDFHSHRKQHSQFNKMRNAKNLISGSSDDDCSESEDDDDSVVTCDESVIEDTNVAAACDDGCVRIYSIPYSDQLIYNKSLPRVSGRSLSVTWSLDANKIYSGSSDGFIRCWDARTAREIYRITVGLGGLGSGPELCIWALLALRCGTLVSGDSNGTVQFWDSQLGTLLQTHSHHKGDVNALSAVPTHNRIFSAGSDGQVILYKLSRDEARSNDEKSVARVMKKWVYVGYLRAHTHDVRALTVAAPISREDIFCNGNAKKARVSKKPLDFSYHKWAHLGVPMLISAGDDTKLFAYSANEFTQFSPHDICPAPQKPPIQLVVDTVFNKTPLLLIQSSYWLDIFCVREKTSIDPDIRSGPVGGATTDLVVRIKSKASQKIICSSMSNSGIFFSYSDHIKPSLFKLSKSGARKSPWTVEKRKLPLKLPFAHSMCFTFDSSRLMVAGSDRRIYVVDVESLELINAFTPRRKEINNEMPSEPPITKMFTSSDGQWLAAINCFGDIHVFNLEIQRQHWFISRLDGASVTAGGFTPRNSNILVVSTSSNQVYVFDVDAKQLGEWSSRHTFILPQRFQEFPGEVIGLTFPPSLKGSSVIVYSARSMCLIDFGRPVDEGDDNDLVKDLDKTLRKLQTSPINGKLKRKLKNSELETKQIGRKNFEFCAFRDPVLFVGHLSTGSLLVIEKPWMQVLKTFDSQPIHRHIYGT